LLLAFDEYDTAIVGFVTAAVLLLPLPLSLLLLLLLTAENMWFLRNSHTLSHIHFGADEDCDSRDPSTLCLCCQSDSDRQCWWVGATGHISKGHLVQIP
jgi:hypothetical protein